MPEHIDFGFGSLDVDSEYASTIDTDTTSLAVESHVFEGGRRFHGRLVNNYAMPDDEMEHDRMELQHHICLLALKGKLYKSPALKKPQMILDLGTGTGAWAIDCANLYPEAQVIGIDLSPIQPKWVPPNVTFEVDDVEELWPYEENSFDMVHIRQLSGFISDWPKLYRQALRVLKPGGVLEIQDFLHFGFEDGAIPENSHVLRWCDLFLAGIRGAGREILSAEHAAGLIKVGFERVKYDPVKIPVGSWSEDKAEKELGLYMAQHMLDGLEGVSLALFVRILGWSKKDMDTLLEGVRSEIRNRKYRIYTKYHVTYGKKPLGRWWHGLRMEKH